MKCPNCQMENPDTQSFCGQCGTKLASPQDTRAFTRTLETPFPQLSKGTTLADRYEILEELGKGGMGEVYLAEDKNLKRRVAVKVLPRLFALDKERLARFEREARLLASLNHPNIAMIHGLEKSDDQQFLVMELAEGVTLRERISKSPLAVDEALAICKQIAEGFESAHEKGIIHRDLKPANVKVTPEGKVKILDFGIAKAFQEQPDEHDAAQSPDIADEMTRPGVILGTAAYMSPEQAKGRSVDKRADIWAFGCILYECLSGKRAFKGDTVSEMLASILKDEPDWSDLPIDTPLQLQNLLRRCLQKNANRRLHDVADARIEIEEVLSRPSGAVAFGIQKSDSHPLWKRAVPWMVAASSMVVALIALWNLRGKEPSEFRRTARFVIPLSSDLPIVDDFYPSVAISPDASCFVYVAFQGGDTKLVLRYTDRIEAESIPGTEGAFNPFFSPDGRWIGFSTIREMKKVSLTGGLPLPLGVGSVDIRGAYWGPHDSILFTPKMDAGLWRISSNGGALKSETVPDENKDEISHRWPQILPGGKGVIFTVEAANIRSFDEARIAIMPQDQSAWMTLIEGGTYARYVPTGHLVYSRKGSIFAVPFDLKTLRKTGRPTLVLEGVKTDPTTGAAHFSYSEDGSLLYIPAPEAIGEPSLVWVDRRGQAQTLEDQRGGLLTEPTISPDGKAIAVTIAAATDSIWVYEIERGTWTLLSFGGSDYDWPTWTPDSKSIVFAGFGPHGADLFWRSVDLSSQATELLIAELNQIPNSCSPDGRLLAYTEFHPSTGPDIWLLSLVEKKRKPEPLISTPASEYGAMISPDGRWIAYVSNESGKNEVYVQEFPDPGGKWLISAAGGSEPVWSPDGSELFYRTGNKIMSVALKTDPTFTASRPKVLFEGDFYYDRFRTGRPNYDISPDGQKFLMLENSEGSVSTQLILVLNWFDELKRLAPTGK